MSKQVIAIDIDDVLFPFIPTLAEHYNAVAGTAITSKDFFSYHFSEVLGIGEQETNMLVASLLRKDLVYLQPVKGAQKALTHLKQDFSIVLVTARNGIFESSTRKWLLAHFDTLFDDVIFAGNPHDTLAYREKGEVCNELGACMLVDDSPANLLSALDFGVDAVLFGHHPWNEVHGLPEGIPRCSDWQEALDYIYASKHARNIAGTVRHD